MPSHLLDPAELPPIPWSLLADAGLTIVVRRSTGQWYWSLDAVPKLESCVGPFAGPLDAVADALEACVGLLRDPLDDDPFTLELDDIDVEVPACWQDATLPPPRTRLAERWNRLAVDDLVAVSGLRGSWVVVARSPHDDNLVLLQHPEQPHVRLEALADHCRRVPLSQPLRVSTA
jgi:hypothetical protein